MKRRGFTLIELMVVIAIIIILAAIAIPNYLNMTARAKKSRVASDFAALATALETFRTDWGVYPTTTAAFQTLVTGGVVYKELSTVGAGVAVTNVSTKTTAAGDTGGIVYMTSNILDSMKNPYNSVNFYKYVSSPGGLHWTVYASESTAATPLEYPSLWRSDTTTTLTENASAAPTVPTDTVPSV